MNITVRSEQEQDYKHIYLVNQKAFDRENEAQLVNQLRKNKKFNPLLSLVAEVDNSLVGHLLLFPNTITDNETIHPTLALGPMAVLPEFQKQGVGKALIKSALKVARQEGYFSIIVLGHPEYYPKFGFKKASAFNIKPPFDVPDEAFMAVEITPNGLTNIRGIVNYPDEYLDCE